MDNISLVQLVVSLAVINMFLLIPIGFLLTHNWTGKAKLKNKYNLIGLFLCLIFVALLITMIVILVK